MPSAGAIGRRRPVPDGGDRARPGVSGKPETIEILGVRFDNLSPGEVLERIQGFVDDGRPHSIFTPNVDFLMLARRDAAFRAVVNAADLSLCDSVPLLWAARLLGTPLKGRVAGSDLLPEVCALAVREGYRVYFLGAAPGVAARAAERLMVRYPGLQVVGTHSPPMGFQGTPPESREISHAIRSAGPDVLFVALGTPKQEHWIARHIQQLGVPVLVGVGASFDFIAGRARRAPKWMQDSGLEWFYRLCREPGRLWKRYLLRDSPFVFLLLREALMARSRPAKRPRC